MMKTKQLESKARNAMVTGERLQVKPGSPAKSFLSQTRTDRSRIQWPTGQQIEDVSKNLARIGREGRRSESSGDYFKSGDLAYQMQEIIRLTRELLMKSQRAKT